MTEQNQTPDITADDSTDDAEGHVLRSRDDENDDTEGHLLRSRDDDDDDDAEGHGLEHG